MNFACLDEASSPGGSLAPHDPGVSFANDWLRRGIPDDTQRAGSGIASGERHEPVSRARREYVGVGCPEAGETLSDVHRYRSFEVVKGLPRHSTAPATIRHDPVGMDAPKEAPSILDRWIVRGWGFDRSGQTPNPRA